MRSYWIVLFLFFVIGTEVFAQDARSVKSLKEEADRYYEEEQYNLAIQYYRELTDQDVKDPEVGFRLADSYLKTFNYSEAEVYYLKVHFMAPDQFPLALYYYALMLKFNANFDESMTNFDEFIARHQNNKELKEYVEQAMIDRAGCETAKEEAKVAYDPKFIALNLNTKYNDYAPAVRDSLSVVITSGRVASNRQSIDERFGEAFTDNFYFEKQGVSWVDKTKQVFSVTNTRYNDGSGCFSSKGDKYYFTVCGMDGPQCRVFVTTYTNNKWSEPVPLNSNVNFKSFEAKHPAISHGGDTLVFSSNRGGGFGRFDLWMCIDAGDDNWGPAMNLGSGINTKLNELSPAFTTFPNVLFFASDGHEGYGGLDLYMTKRLSTGETLLFNLDFPFNSNRDDCFLSFSEHELYWSSNRPDGQGGFDITAVRIPSILAFISKLSLKKRNARRDINLKSKTEDAQRLNLQASRLEEKIDYDKLSYEKRQIVEEMIQNRIRNSPNEPDQFKVTLQEFKALKQVAESRYDDMRMRKNGYLNRVTPPLNSPHDLSVTGVLTDSITNNKLGARKVVLTNELGEVLKITKTNEDGRFKFTDVPATHELYVKLERSNDAGDAMAVIRDLVISASTEQELRHYENIYFDFDHYRIRPEARRVLDELATHLIRNPGVQVEIFAFADDRGTDEYNIRLTQKRGQSVVEYLTGKGVDQTSLAIIAKGKQDPQRVDTELQRQFNRRVEFYLNGNSDTFREVARTFIVRKKTNWDELAQMTKTTKEILKGLNGASEGDVKAFQPIRLPIAITTVPSEWFYSVH